MYRAGNDAVILDVLTLCTKQCKGVCGLGYGTRMVNFLKMYLLGEGRKIQAEHPTGLLPVKCFFLTQADDGPKALNFWLKQTLTQGVVAKKAMEAMHEANPKQNVWYNNAIPMMCELNSQTLRVEESQSERAQNVPEESSARAAASASATPEDGGVSASASSSGGGGDDEGGGSPRVTRTSRRQGQSVDVAAADAAGQGTPGKDDDDVTRTPVKQRVRSPIATRGSRSKGGPGSGLGKWAHLVQRITKIEV